MARACLVTWTVERALWKQGCTHIAGIDEAGRGALAGPVVAAAVILPPGLTIPNVDDSKRLSREKREALFQEILRVAMAVGVGYTDASVIDRVNIRQGTLLAMQAAIPLRRSSPRLAGIASWNRSMVSFWGTGCGNIKAMELRLTCGPSDSWVLARCIV
jgi:hypothetical protein